MVEGSDIPTLTPESTIEEVLKYHPKALSFDLRNLPNIETMRPAYQEVIEARERVILRKHLRQHFVMNSEPISSIMRAETLKEMVDYFRNRYIKNKEDHHARTLRS